MVEVGDGRGPKVGVRGLGNGLKFSGKGRGIFIGFWELEVLQPFAVGLQIAGKVK